MNPLKKVAVFCGASNHAPDHHKQLAYDVGKRLAQDGFQIIYGGGRVGLMGIVADSCLEYKGTITGVMPKFLVDYEINHPGLTDLIHVKSMPERKAKMAELADSFLILPGGFGTLDETCEILSYKQIRVHHKPIVVLDCMGYWQPLKAMLQHIIAHHYALPAHENLLEFCPDLDSAIEALQRISPETPDDLHAKWGT